MREILEGLLVGGVRVRWVWFSLCEHLGTIVITSVTNRVTYYVEYSLNGVGMVTTLGGDLDRKLRGKMNGSMLIL